MSDKPALTLKELIIVLAVLAALAVSLAVFFTGRARVQWPHVNCMRNLMSIGKALAVYRATTQNDQYPWIRGRGWQTTPTGTNRNVAPNDDPRSVSSLLFLLVRQGETPVRFVCPSDRGAEGDQGIQDELTGEYYWDFSSHRNVSYSYQAPLRDEAPRRGAPACHSGVSSYSDGNLVVLADKTPAVDFANWAPPDWRDEALSGAARRRGISQNHGAGELVNYLRYDISVRKSARGDVGIVGDNIYTAGPGPRGVTDIARHTDANDSYLIGPVK
jgi:hypothetical protein